MWWWWWSSVHVSPEFDEKSCDGNIFEDVFSRICDFDPILTQISPICGFQACICVLVALLRDKLVVMNSFFVACQLPLTMLVDGLKELESCAFEFGG